jgi:hypothetical protein
MWEQTWEQRWTQARVRQRSRGGISEERGRSVGAELKVGADLRESIEQDEARRGRQSGLKRFVLFGVW